MSNNVIKRRHTSEYAQIHNKPLQDDLTDLRAIGLLSHMMSRPAEWVFHKTQLHKQFSRKNVDAAWKLLVEKKYIVGFYCHKDGHKSYYYNVSDLPFTDEEYYEFVKEEVSELTEKGHSIKHINPIPGLTLDTTEFSSSVPNVQQTTEVCSESGAPREQFSGNSSKGASINKELINTDKKTKKNNNIKIDDDKANSVTPAPKQIESLTEVINSLRLQTKDLLVKRSFDSVLRKVIDKYEQGKVSNFRDYLVTSLNAKIEELELRRIKEQAKQNLANRDRNEEPAPYTGQVPFYNWLDEEEAKIAKQPLKIS
ncbi:hypothetical protein A6E27_22855 [Bacillus cereus]|nr:hypothetical protein A6E27_22855 [Bacillus cereus]